MTHFSRVAARTKSVKAAFILLIPELVSAYVEWSRDCSGTGYQGMLAVVSDGIR